MRVPPPDPSTQHRATALLREALGAEAGFREGQWEAIRALAEQCRRVLVVQRTGWGKSLVYFIATRLLRDQGAGPTVLISPLLSLMRNQIQAAAAYGIRAVTVVSDYQQIGRAGRGLSHATIILMHGPEDAKG
jgi:ATP-dependent DNA helicase RecQ